MPIKLKWSSPRDAVLCRLRAEGATWDKIATELVISRNGAIERGRRLGARLPTAPQATAAADPNRSPLAAGAPESWGPLIAGSLLADSKYLWRDPLARILAPISRQPDSKRHPTPTSKGDIA